MPLLNTAAKMYAGSVPATAVYAGSTKVWPAAPPAGGSATITGTTTWQATSTGHTFTMPGSVAVGDLLIVTVGLGSSSRAITFTGTAEVANQSTSGHRCAIGIGLWNGGAVGYGIATSYAHVASLTAVRGVTNVGAVVGQGLVASGSLPPMVTPAITVPTSMRFGFSVVCRSATTTTTFDPPVQVTELFDQSIAGGTCHAGGSFDFDYAADGQMAWGQAVSIGGNGSVFTLGLAYSP